MINVWRLRDLNQLRADEKTATVPIAGERYTFYALAGAEAEALSNIFKDGIYLFTIDDKAVLVDGLHKKAYIRKSDYEPREPLPLNLYHGPLPSPDPEPREPHYPIPRFGGDHSPWQPAIFDDEGETIEAINRWAEVLRKLPNSPVIQAQGRILASRIYATVEAGVYSRTKAIALLSALMIIAEQSHLDDQVIRQYRDILDKQILRY